MRRVMWILLGLGALLWTSIAWLLHSIAGSGEAAVMTMTRWLQIEPASTIWLAEILAAIGGPTQVLVWIGWALGMAALGLVAWFGTRVADEAAAVSRGLAAGAGPGGERLGSEPVFEGQIRGKVVSEAPPPAPERPFDG